MVDEETLAKALFDAKPHAHPLGHTPDWNIQPQSIKDAFRRMARQAMEGSVMSDQSVPAVTVGGPPTSARSPLLPTQQANHFTGAVNASEILIGVGVSRASVNQTPQGPIMQGGVEWVVTLSISPFAASALHAILKSSIETFEKQFGKIPQDPNFKIATMPQQQPR